MNMTEMALAAVNAKLRESKQHLISCQLSEEMQQKNKENDCLNEWSYVLKWSERLSRPTWFSLPSNVFVCNSKPHKPNTKEEKTRAP